MMQSLFAGVSGLRSHQRRMDVIGNNVANVNTVGFKAARATFQDVLYNTLRGAGAPQGNRGGTNPMQVGLGVQIGSIDTLFTPGNPQSTGVETDLMIQGEGLFVVSDGERRFYTRAGNFYPDQQGYLTAPGGYKVLGWMADPVTGVIDPQAGDPVPLRIDKSTMAPRATTQIQISGNLDARTLRPSATETLTVTGVLPAENGTSVEITAQVFDPRGNPRNVTLTFTRESEGSWTVEGKLPGGTVTVSNRDITFDPDDPQGAPNPPTIQLSLNWGSGLSTSNVTLDLTALTQGQSQLSSSVTGTELRLSGQLVLQSSITVPVDPSNSGTSTELTFSPDDSDPYTWRVSVGGTSHVLKFDRSTGQLVEGSRWDTDIDGQTVTVDFSDITLDSVQSSQIGGRAPETIRTPNQLIYDSQGRAHEFHLELRPVGGNRWDLVVFVNGHDISSLAALQVEPAGSQLIFDPVTGRLASGSTTSIRVVNLDPRSVDPNSEAAPMSFTVDLAGLTQYVGETTAKMAMQDGFASGTLERFAFDSNGIITGYYSNGLRRELGQVAVATFANPGGLERRGESLFAESPNSGGAQIDAANTGGRGSILPSTLEMSNVDLAQEFTEMILTQRGYQANSRVITTSDEMLQELVNLKR